MLPRRAVVAVVAGWLAFAGIPQAARAAYDPPKLTKAQRALLETLVTAVDQRAGAPPVQEAAPTIWQTHRLRASDGSH